MDNAKETLKSAEASAGANIVALSGNTNNSGGNPRGDGDAGAGLNRSQVQVNVSGKNTGSRGGFSGFMKKRGPLIAILGILGGVGALMVGMQTLMPVAIQEIIIEKFNSIDTSSTVASDVWLDAQLNMANEKVMEKAGRVGDEMFGFTDYQVKSFENKGLKVAKTDSGKVLSIVFKDYDKWVPIVGSELIDRNGIADDIKTRVGLSVIEQPITAETALKNRQFKMPYTEASKTWRGGGSGWFDQMMSKITETKLNVKRNRWARFVAKSTDDVRETFLKNASGDVLDKISDSGVDAIDGDDDGEMSTSTEADTSLNDADGNAEKVNKILNSKAVSAAKVVSGGLDWTCQLAEAMVSIYTVVSAYQNLQYLNLISGYLESTSKMMAGMGDESPVNDYNERLVATGTTNKNGVKKTAMESAGIANLFSNVKVNPNDESVQNVNFEAVMSNLSTITGNVAFASNIYEKCGYAKIGISTTNLVLTVLSVVPIFGQGVSVAKVLVKIAVDTAINFAVTSALGIIIPKITQSVVNVISKNVATEWLGEDLGNALVSAASKYLGGNASSGGQGPGSLSKVTAFMGARDAVIAEEAEYQRATRSPLDVTSKYTFLGSMAYAMMPLAFSNSGAISALKSTASLMSSSAIGTLSMANAVSEADELTNVGDCTFLESAGAIGDAFCNPYIVTDMNTITTEPMQVYKNAYYIEGTAILWWYEIDEEGNGSWKSEDMNYSASFDSNGNVRRPSGMVFDKDGIMLRHGDVDPNKISSLVEFTSSNLSEDGKIISGSNLNKFVVFCGQRVSPYNVKDANIANELADPSGSLSLMSSAPVIGDVADLIRSLRNSPENVAWATGQQCMVSDDNDFWTRNKYFQRYDETMRLLESNKPGYKSEVTAVVEKYYNDNPIDNSLEGQIARFAGMEKNDVEDTLALLSYYERVADYDASLRYMFGEEIMIGGLPKYNFYSEKMGDGAYILLYTLSYGDLRNRNFVV